MLGVEGVGEWDKPGPVTLSAQRATNDLIRSELREVASASR